jgi:hypothetical protein
LNRLYISSLILFGLCYIGNSFLTNFEPKINITCLIIEHENAVDQYTCNSVGDYEGNFLLGPTFLFNDSSPYGNIFTFSVKKELLEASNLDLHTDEEIRSKGIYLSGAYSGDKRTIYWRVTDSPVDYNYFTSTNYYCLSTESIQDRKQSTYRIEDNKKDKEFKYDDSRDITVIDSNRDSYTVEARLPYQNKDLEEPLSSFNSKGNLQLQVLDLNPPKNSIIIARVNLVEDNGNYYISSLVPNSIQFITLNTKEDIDGAYRNCAGPTRRLTIKNKNS